MLTELNMVRSRRSKVARRVMVPLASAALALGLVACGDGDEANDGANGSPVQPAQREAGDATGTPAGLETDPHTVLVTAEDGPEGAEYTTLDQILADSDFDEGAADMLRDIAQGSLTNPEACGALEQSAAFALALVADNPQQLAVAEYTVGEGENAPVYHVLVSTTDQIPEAPQSVEECATFTRVSTNSVGQSETTYSANPCDVSIEDADESVAVVTTLEGTKIGDMEGDFGNVGEESYLIAGRVNGVYFQARANTPGADPELVRELAQRQVDKLRGR